MEVRVISTLRRRTLSSTMDSFPLRQDDAPDRSTSLLVVAKAAMPLDCFWIFYLTSPKISTGYMRRTYIFVLLRRLLLHPPSDLLPISGTLSVGSLLDAGTSLVRIHHTTSGDSTTDGAFVSTLQSSPGYEHGLRVSVPYE